MLKSDSHMREFFSFGRNVLVFIGQMSKALRGRRGDFERSKAFRAEKLLMRQAFEGETDCMFVHVWHLIKESEQRVFGTKSRVKVG
jgi:hypothetical protein